MINGLDIPHKKRITNISSGSGLYLTKNKGGACNKTCNKKRTVIKQNGRGLKILK